MLHERAISRPASYQAHLSQLNTPLTAPRLAYNWRTAALAGILAAAAITVYMMTVPRLLGIEQMDIGITVGDMSDSETGAAYLIARLAWHIVNGVIYVFAYAGVLVYLQRQSTMRTGMCFGLFLWFFGPMLLVPLLLNFTSGAANHPGIFMHRLGLGCIPAVVDLGAHMTHGIIVGVVCKQYLKQFTTSATAAPATSIAA